MLRNTLESNATGRAVWTRLAVGTAIACLAGGGVGAVVGGLWGSPWTARAMVRVARTDQQMQGAGGMASLALELGLPVGAMGATDGPELLVALFDSRTVINDAIRDTTGGGASWLSTWAAAGGDTTRAHLPVGAFRERSTARVDGPTGIILVTVADPDSLAAERHAARWLAALQRAQEEHAVARLRANSQFTRAALDSTREALAGAERDWASYASSHAAYQLVPAERVEAARREQRFLQLQQMVGTLERASMQARLDDIRERPVLEILDRPEGSAMRASLRLRGAVLGALLAALLVSGLVWLRFARGAFSSSRGA